jgi:hypothetical protein
MPQSLAASPREYPSSSNASPNIRRAALAALLQAAACRKPAAVRSARLIVTAFGIEVSANHGQPAENHTSACLQTPAESKVNSAGITHAGLSHAIHKPSRFTVGGDGELLPGADLRAHGTRF